MIPDDAFAKWLQRPKHGRRKEWNSYLFMPYSPKLSDTIYLYTPDKFNHWVNVEWNAKIISFNESPPVVEIPCEGKLNRVQFDMACLHESNRLILHRLVSLEKSPDQNIEGAIDRWVLDAGLTIERIEVESLSRDDLELERKKDFISFIITAKADPNLCYTDMVLDFIARTPGVTIFQIQNKFSDIDPTTVIAIIGKLLMLNKITANLKSRLLDRNLRLTPR